MKDKTFYIPIYGQMVRIRARKQPDNETMEALTELVKKVWSGRVSSTSAWVCSVGVWYRSGIVGYARVRRGAKNPSFLLYGCDN